MSQTSNPKIPILVGARIRDLRKHKKMSIRDFAAQIDVSAGHVSLIERNLIEPSLTVLRRICEVLETPIPMLLSDDSSDLTVTQRGAISPYAFPDGTAAYRFRTPYRLKSGHSPQIIVTTGTIPPFSRDHEEYVVHDSEEYVYVLSGRIEYHTEQGVYPAAEGDSLHMEPRVPHIVYNPTGQPAEVLAVISTPWRALEGVEEE